MNRAALTELLRRYEVKIAYIFGSQKATGAAVLAGEKAAADESSDLDVGVVFERLPEDRFGVYGDLFADLSYFFEAFRIDLVFLQETDALLQYEAIKGELVYCENELFLDDYEEMVMKQASDIAYKKIEFERDFIEALRDGYFELAR
jgi:predicted nucleotidyltransferase